MHEQKTLKKFTNKYFLAVLAVILLSCMFFIVSNFTSLPLKQSLDETGQHSMEISKALYEMEESFDQYGRILGRLIAGSEAEGNQLKDDNGRLRVLSEQLNIVLRQFIEEQDMATGYFFELNAAIPAAEYELYFNKGTGRTAHITTLMSSIDVKNINNIFIEEKVPLWNTNYNAFSDTVNLQYLFPFYENGEYIGFMGITVNIDKLKDVIEVKEDGREFGLLTDTKEVLLHPSYKSGEALSTIYDGKLLEAFEGNKLENAARIKNGQGNYIIISYTSLPSGQIFFVVQELFHKMIRVNLLTMLAAALAVLIILIIRKNEVTGKSVFNNLVDMIIAIKDSEPKASKALSEDEENRMKAVIAMGIGICMMLTAFGIYQVIFESNVIGFFMYAALSLCIYFLLYQYIKGRISEIVKFMSVCLMFLVTTAFHIMKGGFSEFGTGAAISWMLGILVFGCFFVKSELMKHVFAAFVIFLSLDVMAELYFLQNSYYERMLVFVTSLLYAGFSLYTAVSIYLKESISDGKRITSLLGEVRETKSFLIQQEKMAALGQLISGVAHEINTPVGAVKAAAQTMDTGLLPMLRLLKRCKEEFEDADYECFYRLIKLASDGIKEMKSTVEIRQAKKVMKAYLDEIDLPEREEVLEMLIRLEITDIDIIKEEKAVLGNPDLCDILKIVVSLSGFIVGIKTILFATSRVSRIVFALKSYAYTNTSNEMASMDLIKNIENILILYHNQIKQNIKVVKEYGDGIAGIIGKPEELAQVWTNLIQNAVYAMKEGGTLTIAVYAKEEGLIEVMIGDTGAGMNEEVIEHIYEPLYTTKPLGEGSGLGLDISRKVVEAHGGTIRVESKPDEGTRFYIILPAGHENDEIGIKETVQ